METSASHTFTQPRIAYRQEGEGPPVLMIMGFGMRGEVWGAQVEGLRERYRVAVFDHRGIGDSETHRGVWSMRDMAQDSLRVADALGWNTFHLVGVSMGGMVAQEVALRAPSRLRTLSLIATQPGGLLSWLPTLEGIKLFLGANKDDLGRLSSLEQLLYPKAFREACAPEALADRMKLQFHTPPPRHTRLVQLSAVIRLSAGLRLKRRQLDVPTLIVQPGQDILIHPRQSDRLCSCLPNARLLRLDDAGHGLIYQCADRLNEALDEHFLSA